MYKRVMQSGNYYQALHIISEYVETELSVSDENRRQENRSFWNVFRAIKRKVKNSRSADKKG